MQQLIRKSLRYFRKRVTNITFYTYNIYDFMICYAMTTPMEPTVDKRMKNEQVQAGL